MYLWKNFTSRIKFNSWFDFLFLDYFFFFSYSNLGSLGKREGFLYLYIFANLQKYTYN